MNPNNAEVGYSNPCLFKNYEIHTEPRPWVKQSWFYSLPAMSYSLKLWSTETANWFKSLRFRLWLQQLISNKHVSCTDFHPLLFWYFLEQHWDKLIDLVGPIQFCLQSFLLFLTAIWKQNYLLMSHSTENQPALFVLWVKHDEAWSGAHRTRSGLDSENKELISETLEPVLTCRWKDFRYFSGFKTPCNTLKLVTSPFLPLDLFVLS